MPGRGADGPRHQGTEARTRRRLGSGDLSGEPRIGDTGGMLPEDGHSESVRADRPGLEGVRDAAGEEGARASTPKPDEIRIDGKIGTDPEELKRWANHVVAGKPIEHMEIADLRALIEAVQAHPEAKLAPMRGEGASQENEQECGPVACLDVRVGRVLRSDLSGLCIRIRLTIATTLHADASFAGATFEDRASLDGTTFRHWAWFDGAAFKAFVSFSRATFSAGISFDGTLFENSVYFDSATFANTSSFEGAQFWGMASFTHTFFATQASFKLATFIGPTLFDYATFTRKATFEGVSFSNLASFRGTLFARRSRFGDTFFHQGVVGDLRAVNASDARAALMDARRRHSPWIIVGAWQERESRLASLIAAHQETPWEKHDPVPGVFYRACRAVARPVVILRELWPLHRENKAFWRVLRQMIRSRLIYGAVGWNLVRALGRLSILNRVSLVALIAVPVLAAAYGAAQKIVTAPNGASAPVWIKWFARAVGGSPHLSETLALTFFASVLVTIGLLIYQAFAPDTIKQRDEDEHVRDLETRYSDENPSLRGDGLRRSIERLEDQAKVRPNRHPSFVKHHGDMIWIPPRDKPEWFKDDDLEEAPFRARVREALREARDRLGQPADDASLDEAMKKLDIIPPKQRSGFVPGAERARICIEEGARAEYWLKAHEKIGWAWMSLVCYLLGIAILLVILFIQCRSVARAAWWPEATQDATRSTG